jgi:hypothetical protein|tara:strand:+ start:163 stop:426 length:264 start_codon:yes stop_codon:yes gene_type:complete
MVCSPKLNGTPFIYGFVRAAVFSRYSLESHLDVHTNPEVVKFTSDYLGQNLRALRKFYLGQGVRNFPRPTSWWDPYDSVAEQNAFDS